MAFAGCGLTLPFIGLPADPLLELSLVTVFLNAIKSLGICYIAKVASFTYSKSEVTEVIAGHKW